MTPFKGRPIAPPPPMRVLHRFTKPGGHTAEIRERIVTEFQAIEFFVFVDRGLVESQMFHRDRVREYSAAMAARVAQFVNGGWVAAAGGMSSTP